MYLENFTFGSSARLVIYTNYAGQLNRFACVSHSLTFWMRFDLMGNSWPRERSEERSYGLCCGSEMPIEQETPSAKKPNNDDGLRHGLEKDRRCVVFDHRVTFKYEVKALIGRGAFSKVVRVEDKLTKEPLAIKVVETRSSSARSLKTEIGILRQVQHPNVIQLREVYVGESYVYMVMELAIGGDLFDRIVARGRFPEREASHIAFMLLDGLSYLHSKGITHRDLKPENLLYYHPGSDSKIMISDFGLSHNCQYLDRDSMVTPCGTPEYIAPEVLRRKPYTSAVDLWALGVIVFVLLSGHLPFYDDNRRKLYRYIEKADYNYNSQVGYMMLFIYTCNT